MARVKFSPIVTNISGSVGGVTFQRNKFGNTMRRKPLPINPSSTAQYLIRQHMITIQAGWQALTDAQRLQWKRFPDFSGQTIRNDRSVRLSGHALYIKYQMMRLMCGLTLLTTIVYGVLPAFPVFGKISNEAGLLYVHFTSVVDDTKYFFLLSLSSPRQPSRHFSPSRLRFMKVTYEDNTFYNLDTPYTAAFGVIPSVGDTLHVTLQWFSVLSPLYAGVTSWIEEVAV